MRETFRKFAQRISAVAGSPGVFILAVVAIIVWAVSGPMFGFSDTWQLMINTSTTILTFLMVFLIQNTQNRDARAIQLKLDELIRSISAARNTMVDLESLSDDELDRLQNEFQRFREKHARLTDRVEDAVEAIEEVQEAADQLGAELTPEEKNAMNIQEQ